MIETAESDLTIGYNRFSSLKEHIDLRQYGSVFLLADKNCYRLYSEKINRIFGAEIENDRLYTHSPEDEIADLSTVEEASHKLNKSGIKEGSLLVSLGGNSVLNLGGFISSLYKGGIDHMIIPTTLTSQIRLCDGGRYFLGTTDTPRSLEVFSPPSIRLVDPSFLDTLNREQIIGGTLEMLRVSIISDSWLFADLEEIPGDLAGIGDSRKADLISKTSRLYQAMLGRRAGAKKRSKEIDFGHDIAAAIPELPDLPRFIRTVLGMITAIELSGFISDLSPGVSTKIIGKIVKLAGGSHVLAIKGDEVWVNLESDYSRVVKGVNISLLRDIGLPIVKTIYKDQFLTALGAAKRVMAAG